MPFWRRNRNETPEREVDEPVDPDFVDPSWEPDPADFADPEKGLSSLLTQIEDLEKGKETRSGDQILTTYSGTLPGAAVKEIIPSADAKGTYETEVGIDENDLRIDVFRSSGPGGQGVNTTDSAVRITHLPTGIVVSCQNERSQLQNREQAMRMLRARLTAAAEEAAADAASAARRSQVRTVDRSERIRTYNFPENRVTDHRIRLTLHRLDQVLDGDLNEVTEALRAEEQRQALAAASA